MSLISAINGLSTKGQRPNPLQKYSSVIILTVLKCLVHEPQQKELFGSPGFLILEKVRCEAVVHVKLVDCPKYCDELLGAIMVMII
jgi:hypothetical protein